MKNKLIKCIFPLLFLAGLSLLLYPLISNKWNDYRQSKLISTYDEALAAQSTEGKIDYAGEKAAALAYNEGGFLNPRFSAFGQLIAPFYFSVFLRVAKKRPAAIIMMAQPPMVKIVVPMPPVEGRPYLQTTAA